MNQSRLESLLESVVNIVIGYGVAVSSQMIIFPMLDIHIPTSTNFVIGFWFTIISLVRSYVIRRWFNAGLSKVIRNTTKQLIRWAA